MVGDLIRALMDDLRSVYGGRSWILAWDVLAASTPFVNQLLGMGATRVFALAGSEGTGPTPNVPSFLLGVGGVSVMEAIRVAEAAMAKLPDAAQTAVEAFDPERTACVLRPMFGALDFVAGRPVFGARPLAWRALEDKTQIDALWDHCGVRRAPCQVVEASAAALSAAAQALDRGAGTVWAADNRFGFHGGAELTRWVVDQREAEQATTMMAASAHNVRVMPMLEGRPCSIHGWVVNGEVLVFRPVEMVVLRKGRRFVYAGCASYWDPASNIRAEMRRVARRVGHYLRDSVGYRGAFTVDGVVSAAGFLPTELNPRFGAGLMVLGLRVQLPLYLLHCATIEGAAPMRFAQSERQLLRRFDRARASSCHLAVQLPVSQERALAVRFKVGADGCDAIPCSPPDAEGGLVLGPGPLGGVVRVVLDPTRTPIGLSVASRVAAALSLASVAFGTDTAELVAAPEA